MSKPSIKELHKFMTEDLRKEILQHYLDYLILSEADLQSHVWQILSGFLKEKQSKKELHKVLNKPYLKELNVYPDLVVFRHGKPWVIIELKETKQIKQKTIDEEFDLLIEMKEHFESTKRGYLLHVSRYKSKKGLKGPKGAGAYFLYEIPIVLEDVLIPNKIKEWEEGRKKWAKYVHE
jgi:hypothetical protein